MKTILFVLLSVVLANDPKPTNSRLEKVVLGKKESSGKLADVEMVAPTPQQEKALRTEFLKLCAIERKDFVKKYPAVGENPQKTCVCLDRAMTDLKSLNVWKTANATYSDKLNEKEEESQTASEFFDQAEMNCLVDPEWKVGVYQPEGFDEKWAQIEKAMLVRELKKTPLIQAKGENSPLQTPTPKPKN